MGTAWERKVEVDPRDLAWPKHVRYLLARAGDEYHVAQALLESLLRGIDDADGFAVDAHKQYVRFASGGLGQKVSLSAAKVDPHLAEGTLAPQGKASLSPAPGKVCRAQFDGVCVFFYALLKDEVLGKARVHSVHRLLEVEAHVALAELA